MTTSLMDDNSDQLEIDPNKSYYEELVGEGKKFTDNEALAKAKATSDNYIKTLERRLDEMREDFVKASDEAKNGRKVAELLDRLEKGNPDPASRNEPNANEDNRPDKFDPKEFESLVSSKIQEHERSKTEEQNFNTVREKLQERFGRDYKNVLKEQSDQLGLTDEEVNSLARKNPKLFMKTFDLDISTKKEGFQTPPRSAVTSNFTPVNQKRTYSYYKQLREQSRAKNDPDLYYNPKIAVQMEKDSQELGAAFFDD